MKQNKDATSLELSLNGNTAQIRIHASPTAATFLIAHAIVNLPEVFNISVGTFRAAINGAIDDLIELKQEKKEQEKQLSFEDIVEDIFGLK